eukprot:1392273-Amorphochlora_amoeboformis.AAC.1
MFQKSGKYIARNKAEKGGRANIVQAFQVETSIGTRVDTCSWVPKWVPNEFRMDSEGLLGSDISNMEDVKAGGGKEWR